MVFWDNHTRRYTVVVGSTIRYADKLGDANVIKAILEFGVKLDKLLK